MRIEAYAKVNPTLEVLGGGWHGMYELSGQATRGRVYPLDLDFSVFREHAILAAKQWSTQRQWFDHKWVAKPKDN